MSENYEILIVSDGGSTMEDEFRAFVATSLECILDTSELVRIHSDIESVSPDSSVLVVYLQGESATGPGGATEILTKAIESQLPVLPITSGPPGRLPDVIAHINALDWRYDRTTKLSAVLRMFGLAEYEIVIVSDDASTMDHEFREAVLTRLRCIDRSFVIRIHSDIESVSPDSSVLVVYLQGKSPTGSGRVTKILTEATELQLPVLPITWGPPGRLPDMIAHINAWDWKVDRTTVLSAVPRMLGLAEFDRKVFLSYARKDSSPLAIQLHTALVQRQYDVFLDCFSVPPGIDFQDRLDQDLGDKAFVVLLESANVRESPWVEYEVSYALAHGVSILAVTFPGLAPEDLALAIDDAFRVRLDTSDLDSMSGKLNENGLRKILDRIEWDHAHALRRRRKALIGSLRKSLELTGHDLAPVEEWTVLAEKNGDRRIYSVTPRRPRPEDLFALCRIKGRLASKMHCAPLGASLVHDAALSASHQHLLRWISFPWNFQVRAVHELSLKGGS